jgi:uncharacterized protein YaiL (DUF2058 family)
MDEDDVLLRSVLTERKVIQKPEPKAPVGLRGKSVSEALGQIMAEKLGEKELVE